MNKGLFSFLFISVVLFVGALYYSTTIQVPFINMLNLIKLNFHKSVEFVDNEFLLHTFQASKIEDKIKLQNQNVVKMAAQSLSKELPKKVDNFTKLVSIKADGETLSYTFEIDAPDSDQEIKDKDKSRMKKAVTKGICQSSKRFLESDIKISYIYKGAKSKKELFRFNVDKTKCKSKPF